MPRVIVAITRQRIGPAPGLLALCPLPCRVAYGLVSVNRFGPQVPAGFPPPSTVRNAFDDRLGRPKGPEQLASHARPSPGTRATDSHPRYWCGCGSTGKGE